MAEKLAYWLVDAVADELMSSVYNEYRPIITKTVKYASSILKNTLNFLTQISSIGGLSRAGYMVAGGVVDHASPQLPFFAQICNQQAYFSVCATVTCRLYGVWRSCCYGRGCSSRCCAYCHWHCCSDCCWRCCVRLSSIGRWTCISCRWRHGLRFFFFFFWVGETFITKMQLRFAFRR